MIVRLESKAGGCIIPVHIDILEEYSRPIVLELPQTRMSCGFCLLELPVPGWRLRRHPPISRFSCFSFPSPKNFEKGRHGNARAFGTKWLPCHQKGVYEPAECGVIGPRRKTENHHLQSLRESPAFFTRYRAGFGRRLQTRCRRPHRTGICP